MLDKFSNSKGWTILFLFVFPPFGLFLLWRGLAFKIWVKVLVSSLFVWFFIDRLQGKEHKPQENKLVKNDCSIQKIRRIIYQKKTDKVLFDTTVLGCFTPIKDEFGLTTIKDTSKKVFVAYDWVKDTESENNISGFCTMLSVRVGSYYAETKHYRLKKQNHFLARNYVSENGQNKDFFVAGDEGSQKETLEIFYFPKN